MSRKFTVNVVLTESEIVLLKILTSRENSILEVKKARPR